MEVEGPRDGSGIVLLEVGRRRCCIVSIVIVALLLLSRVVALWRKENGWSRVAYNLLGVSGT